MCQPERDAARASVVARDSSAQESARDPSTSLDRCPNDASDGAPLTVLTPDARTAEVEARPRTHHDGADADQSTTYEVRFADDVDAAIDACLAHCGSIERAPDAPQSVHHTLRRERAPSTRHDVHDGEDADGCAKGVSVVGTSTESTMPCPTAQDVNATRVCSALPDTPLDAKAVAATPRDDTTVDAHASAVHVPQTPQRGVAACAASDASRSATEETAATHHGTASSALAPHTSEADRSDVVVPETDHCMVQRALLSIWPPSLRNRALRHYGVTETNAKAATSPRHGKGARTVCDVPRLLHDLCEDKIFVYAAACRRRRRAPIATSARPHRATTRRRTAARRDDTDGALSDDDTASETEAERVTAGPSCTTARQMSHRNVCPCTSSPLEFRPVCWQGSAVSSRAASSTSSEDSQHAAAPVPRPGPRTPPPPLWFASESERQRMAQHILSSGKLRHECPEVFAFLCARANDARLVQPRDTSPE